MIPWLESITARCRGMDQFNTPLADAYVMWEDSVVGPEGYVFCIGTVGEEYFFFEHSYGTFADEPEQEIIMTPKNLASLKDLLLSLKTAKYAKIGELLPVMKFYLT